MANRKQVIKVELSIVEFDNGTQDISIDYGVHKYQGKHVEGVAVSECTECGGQSCENLQDTLDAINKIVTSA